MLKLNSKAQEEAPFELLIAVITMGFVLVIGLVAMNQLRLQKCANELEAQLEDLKTKIEIVVNQKSPQLLDFRQSECYNPKNEHIIISQSNNTRICSDSCASGSSICTLLEYVDSKDGVSFRKCLNINSSTAFIPQNNAGQSCTDLSDDAAGKKILVDFKQTIVRGTYDLLNRTGANTSPIICGYCRLGSGGCGAIGEGFFCLPLFS